MKAKKQTLHFDERIKQISLQQAKEFLHNRPNAHWMSASVGDTEYYFIEKIKEKEVKVPIIQTVTKYILKEIPKEIPVVITKEIEKVITQVVTNEVIKVRNRVIYRQTPEYLKLKHERDVARLNLKRQNYETKIKDLLNEIQNANKEIKKCESIIEKSKSNNSKMKTNISKVSSDKADVKAARIIKKFVSEKGESIIKDIDGGITRVIIASKNLIIEWHLFLYGIKVNGIPIFTSEEYQCNKQTGLIIKSSLYEKKILKIIERNNKKSFNEMKEIISDFPNVIDVYMLIKQPIE